MPHAFVLALRRLNDAPLPARTGDVFHAAFYDLLARRDPALTARLHDANVRKPFTVCLLAQDARKFASPPTAADCVLRITLLDDELFAPFTASLSNLEVAAPLRLGSARFAPADLLTTPAQHPQAGSASFVQLWEQTIPADSLTIRFATPTAFRSHDRDIVWPDTRLLWQSWVDVWNVHAPLDTLKMDKDALLASAERIRIGTYQLQTRPVRFKGVAQMGFVGECRFDLSDLAEAERHRASVLAHFAFYAGTGRKTGIGMGQTRVRA